MNPRPLDGRADADSPAELLDDTNVPTADEVPDALSSKLTSLTIVFSCATMGGGGGEEGGVTKGGR